MYPMERRDSVKEPQLYSGRSESKCETYVLVLVMKAVESRVPNFGIKCYMNYFTGCHIMLPYHTLHLLA